MYEGTTVAGRFAKYAMPEPMSGCWLWTGSLSTAGYGQIKVRSYEREYAHRVSWRLHRGEIAQGMFVCHRCDNPVCCNPDHLFLGSRQDNIDDMTAKGRSAIGRRNARAKLSSNDAAAIRKDPRTLAVIAAEYGVSEAACSLIKSGKTWRHLRLGIGR